VSILFKHADLIRDTGATASQLDYWMRLGLTVPHKDATSSGDHRLFDIRNVIDVALAVWLSTLGMSTDRMGQVFALQRKTMARVPVQRRVVQAWMQYVHMVRAGAQLIGLTDDPAFQEWERGVEVAVRRLTKKPVATDHQIVELLAAQRAAISGFGDLHADK
jgi:DNA-binding transcriptional MerR regulator